MKSLAFCTVVVRNMVTQLVITNELPSCGRLTWVIQIQPNEVAICMCLVKISRQAEDPGVSDNYKDALGYIAIAKTITDAMQDEDGAWE